MNCDTCGYKTLAQGDDWCYMFKDKPEVCEKDLDTFKEDRMKCPFACFETATNCVYIHQDQTCDDLEVCPANSDAWCTSKIELAVEFERVWGSQDGTEEDDESMGDEVEPAELIHKVLPENLPPGDYEVKVEDVEQVDDKVVATLKAEPSGGDEN